MIRRLLSILLLACYVSACSTWRVQPVTPQRLLAEKRPPVIWVTRSAGGGVLLETPFIRNDSLVGWERSKLRNVGIPLAEVARIEIREHDSEKTVYLVLGIVAGVGLLVVLGIYAIVESDL